MPFRSERKTVRAPRSYDQESRKPRVTNVELNKKNKDDESDQNISDQSDSEIESELQMPVKDDTRRKNFRPHKERKVEKTITSSQNAIHEQKESVGPELSVAAAPHMIMRSAVYHMRIAPITFPTASTYVPSFYQFFEMLHAAQRCIQGNTYLKYVSPDYISIASSLYYGFLGIIQVLRAKVIAGIATRPESQCLSKFEREYPFESLPVMSPLVMAFQNLGAIKLSDAMYGWISPTLPDILGTKANEPGIFNSDASICLPNVPALLKFLYDVSHAKELSEITDSEERLVPRGFVANDSSFFGINMNVNGGRNTADYRRLVYSAGILEPVEVSSSIDLTTLRRLRRWNLPQLSQALDLQTVGQFLQTDSSLEWFKNLVRVSADEAKFFKGSTNLANIPPTTNLSSLVEVKYTKTQAPEPVSSFYPFSHPIMRNDLWKFQSTTTRGDTSPDEFKVGATTQFLVTSFGSIVPTNHNGPAATKSGPYFDESMQGRQVDQIESDNCRSPSYSFELLIKKELFDETGAQARV